MMLSRKNFYSFGVHVRLVIGLVCAVELTVMLAFIVISKMVGPPLHLPPLTYTLELRTRPSPARLPPHQHHRPTVRAHPPLYLGPLPPGDQPDSLRPAAHRSGGQRGA